jgi:hypothetical protein
VAATDVLNQIAVQVPQARPINVKDTVVATDVLNRIAVQVPDIKTINV